MINYYLFIPFFLVITFINGFDGMLLYKKAFMIEREYSAQEYIHFYFSIFGGWFIGYFVTKKKVNQFEQNYTFRISLLISSLIMWSQHNILKYSHDYLFSQTIIDNFQCSIVIGFLTYSIINIIQQDKLLSKIKNNKIFLGISLSLGVIYSLTLDSNLINEGFLVSTIIYLIGYFIFFFNKYDLVDTPKAIPNQLLHSLLYVYYF